MRLLSCLNRIHSRPTPHLGRAREKSPDYSENEHLESCPLAHHLRDDPAWIGMVDDDFALGGGGEGDAGGDLLHGVHFEEFGEVVPGVVGAG